MDILRFVAAAAFITAAVFASRAGLTSPLFLVSVGLAALALTSR